MLLFIIYHDIRASAHFYMQVSPNQINFDSGTTYSQYDLKWAVWISNIIAKHCKIVCKANSNQNRNGKVNHLEVDVNGYIKFKFKSSIAISTVYKLLGMCFGALTNDMAIINLNLISGALAVHREQMGQMCD